MQQALREKLGALHHRITLSTALVCFFVTIALALGFGARGMLLEAPIHYPVSFEVLDTQDVGLTIDQVADPRGASRFLPHPNAAFAFPPSERGYWIRFLLPEKDPSAEVVLYANRPLSQMRLYIPDGDSGSFFVSQVGYEVGYQREGPSALHPSFLVPKDYDTTRYSYLFVVSKLYSGFRVGLFEQHSYEKRVHLHLIVLLLVAGALWIVILYHLFIALLHGSRTHFYLGLLIALLLFERLALLGVFRAFDLGLGDLLLRHSTALRILAGFSWLLFSYSFLKVGEHTPYLSSGFVYVGILLAVGYGGYRLIGGIMARRIVFAMSLSLPILGMGTAMESRRMGYFVSPFYAYGLVALFFGMGGSFLDASFVFNAQLSSFGVLVSLLVEVLFYVRALHHKSPKKEKEQVRVLPMHEVPGSSFEDALTELYNAEFFETLLREQVAQAEKTGERVALLLLDIDRFKRINDAYGHIRGNMVLKQLGQVLRRTIGQFGYPCRIGGEEFAVILPKLSLEEALILAEELRQEFAQEKLEIFPGVVLYSSLSIGVTEFLGEESAQKVQKRGDKALYLAKCEGRNCIVHLP